MKCYGDNGNGIGAVLPDYLHRRGWNLCDRGMSHNPYPYKHAIKKCAGNGYSCIIEGSLSHIALDKVVHKNPVFKRAMNSARPHIEGGIDIIKRPPHYVDDEKWKKARIDWGSHVLAEMSLCHGTQKGRYLVPKVLDQWKQSADLDQVSEGLSLILGSSAEVIYPVLERRFATDVIGGEKTMETLSQYSKELDGILEEVGLGTKSAFDDFYMKTIQRTSKHLASMLI